MAYKQVKDIVKIIKEKHRQIRDALEAARSRAKCPKASALLETLRKDEQELQLIMGRSQNGSESSVMETWLQYVPDEDLQRTVKEIDFHESMSVEKIIAEKSKFDRALLEFLDHNIRQTSVPRVEQFFTSLREYVQSRAAEHVWSTREDQTNSELPQVEL